MAERLVLSSKKQTDWGRKTMNMTYSDWDENAALSCNNTWKQATTKILPL